MELKKLKELRLGLHPPQAKLSITSSSGSSINVTHDKKVIRHGIGDGKMANDPRDSRRKK